MGFTNLYTKKTSDPKEIDFARVGTVVKNKITDAAIKAFRAKVTGPQAKPFEFTFDKDGETGKMQIAVKSLGFVYGWVDPDFLVNKAAMKVAETEIEGWKKRVSDALAGVAQHQRIVRDWSKEFERIEEALAAKAVDDGVMKMHADGKEAIEEVRAQAERQHKGMLQFWNSGPNKGVLGLMEKHGISPGQVGGARKEAEDGYAAVQQLLKKYQEQVTALGKDLGPLRTHCDELQTKLYMARNGARDRKTELADLEVAIQKDIGEFQGWKNSDFAGVGAKRLKKEADEFMKKSGAAWAKLSADPVELDRTVARVQGVFERMRVLAGRVEQQYRAWQGPAIPRGGNMPKYQQMLKMVYEEYMVDLNALQDTLRAYGQALTKYKPKAVELAGKAVKAQAKAEAKQVKAAAKAEAKGAKKVR